MDDLHELYESHKSPILQDFKITVDPRDIIEASIKKNPNGTFSLHIDFPDKFPYDSSEDITTALEAFENLIHVISGYFSKKYKIIEIKTIKGYEFISIDEQRVAINDKDIKLCMGS